MCIFILNKSNQKYDLCVGVGQDHRETVSGMHQKNNITEQCLNSHTLPSMYLSAWAMEVYLTGNLLSRWNNCTLSNTEQSTWTDAGLLCVRKLHFRSHINDRLTSDKNKALAIYF